MSDQDRTSFREKVLLIIVEKVFVATIVAGAAISTKVYLDNSHLPWSYQSKLFDLRFQAYKNIATSVDQLVEAVRTASGSETRSRVRRMKAREGAIPHHGFTGSEWNIADAHEIAEAGLRLEQLRAQDSLLITPEIDRHLDALSDLLADGLGRSAYAGNMTSSKQKEVWLELLREIEQEAERVKRSQRELLGLDLDPRRPFG